MKTANMVSGDTKRNHLLVHHITQQFTFTAAAHKEVVAANATSRDVPGAQSQVFTEVTEEMCKKKKS